MVFLGGAVLANIVSGGNHPHFFFRRSNFTQMADKENMWISKAEWQEQGARALEKLGAR